MFLSWGVKTWSSNLIIDDDETKLCRNFLSVEFFPLSERDHKSLSRVPKFQKYFFPSQTSLLTLQFSQMPWLSFFIYNCPNSYAATRNRTHISRVAPNSRGLFEGRPTNWATRPRLLTVLKDPTIEKPTTKRIVQKTWLGFIQETSLDRMNSSSALGLLFST